MGKDGERGGREEKNRWEGGEKEGYRERMERELTVITLRVETFDYRTRVRDT